MNTQHLLPLRLIVVLVILLLNANGLKSQQCLNLTSLPQWVNIGDLDVTGNQITVEALVYYQGGVNILSKHTNPSNVNYLLRTGTFELTTTNGFYLMNNPYAGSMLPNTWYHVAGTYDGSFIRYYVNGCLIIEQPATGNLVNNNLDAAIGSQSNTPAEQYYGKIDEVRIWNIARTEAQISNNMFNLPSPTTQPGLLGYYKMDGNVLNIQGNATYNGSWVGSAAYDTEPTASVIPPFALQNIEVTNSNCPGANNGEILVSATGTSLEYSINGTTWQPSNNFTGVNPGTYDVSVRTQEGCILEDQNVEVSELEIPVPPNVTLSDDELCLNETIDFETTGLAPGGQQANFNGTSSTMGGVDYSALASNNFTYEFWVNPNATRLSTPQSNTGIGGVTQQPQRLVISPLWGGPSASFAGVSVGTNGISVIEHGSGYAPIPLVWNGTISDWVHVAIVYENRTPRLYINGGLVKEGIQSGRATVYPCAGSYNIWASEYFNGSLDNLRIFNYSRTQAQIVTDMYLETPANTAGMIAHYTFNGGNGNAAIGTNTGMANTTFSAPTYFDYTWTGPAPPATTTNEQQTSAAHGTAGSFNYFITAAHNGCNGLTSGAYPITVDAPSTAPAGIIGGGTYCPGNDVTLTLNGGALGTNSSWEWYQGSCGSAVINTGTSHTITTETTATYYVRATASPGCPATPCVSTTVNYPPASGFLSVNGESATCVVDENGWVHFYNQTSGRLLCAINSYGQNLGTVTATSYVQTAPFEVDACLYPQPEYNTATLGRRWVITPQFQPSSAVDVRLYYDNPEYVALTPVANGNQNTYDNTASFADLVLSKYHNTINPALVNSSPFDNCPSGATTLYNPNAANSASSVITGFDPNGRYNEYSIPSFSEFWLHGSSSGSPLPVHLTAFAAVCNNESIDVIWTTASESISAYFVLERSRNGSIWHPVDTIEAAGNASTENNYLTIDTNNTWPESYYRLRQVDMNGSIEFYGPVSVECATSATTLSIYPNPSDGNFIVNIVTDENIPNAELAIHNSQGKMVWSNTLHIKKGSTNFNFQHLSLASGTYYVHLRNSIASLSPVKLVIY